MIRLHRPVEAPAVLDQDVHEPPRSSVFSHTSVRAVLYEAQHGKCCYCEAKYGAVAFGDVEHFRPKAGGYPWLAYTWSNLLLACPRCNSRKSSHFPLADEERRATCPTDDLSLEEPLLIDPFAEDPDDHIGFHEELATSLSDRGQATIDLLLLNEEPREESRRTHLERLRLVRDALGVIEDGAFRLEVTGLLESATTETAEYTAMSQAFLGA